MKSKRFRHHLAVEVYQPPELRATGSRYAVPAHPWRQVLTHTAFLVDELHTYLQQKFPGVLVQQPLTSGEFTYQGDRYRFTVVKR